jgi:hypothetical protein
MLYMSQKYKGVFGTYTFHRLVAAFVVLDPLVNERIRFCDSLSNFVAYKIPVETVLFGESLVDPVFRD